MSGNKKDTSSVVVDLITDIKTKDLRGPNVLKPTEITNAQEFPSLNLNPEKADSQRTQSDKLSSNQISNKGSNKGSNQGSYTASNQLDLNNPYENQMMNLDTQIPRPPGSRRESEGHSSNGKTPSSRENNGILPPPPTRPPVNKIQFPAKNGNGNPNKQPPIPQRPEISIY